MAKTHGIRNHTTFDKIKVGQEFALVASLFDVNVGTGKTTSVAFAKGTKFCKRCDIFAVCINGPKCGSLLTFSPKSCVLADAI
jgi:hypothetical protein